MTGASPSNNPITIELTNDDALLFTSFRQHQDVFDILLKNDVFNSRSATVILHFDLNGKLQKIDRNQILFFTKAGFHG